jgi:hypothetical protein
MSSLRATDSSRRIEPEILQLGLHRGWSPSPAEKFDKLATHHNNLPLPQLDGFVGRADPYPTLLEARGLAIDADGHVLRKAPPLSPGATKRMDTVGTLEVKEPA